MKKISNLASLLLGTSLAFSGCNDNTDHYNDSFQDISTLTKRAIALSSGEDRIWSHKEMREFLDYFQLKDLIISEGESPSFFYKHDPDDRDDHVLVTTGKELAKSYGEISRESLVKYIKEKEIKN